MAKTLFDYPAHHASDPPTSEIAERRITDSGCRAKQANLVYETLKKYNGSTSAELGAILDDRYMPARRLSDLEKAGWVRKGKMRFCAASKSKCVTWWIAR